MYEKHELFDAPFDQDVLWRYMDFTKFVSMLDSRALYFTRADKYEDLFEGRYPKKSMQIYERECRRVHAAANMPAEISEVVIKGMASIFDGMRGTVGINCWHKNKHESAAMWKLYLKSCEGVAVKTTFSKFSKSFINAGCPVLIGNVKYIDFDDAQVDFGNSLSPFLLKRVSFEHEKEVRAIIWKHELLQGGSELERNGFSHGTSVGCDMSILIEEVYVAPTSPDWFKALVVSVVRNYGLEVDVRQSRLDEFPY